MKNIPISYIREMMHRAYKKGAINLAQGTPGFDTPEHIKRAAISALRQGKTQYSPLIGYRELREAISKKLWTYNKIEADPETEVLVTAGAMEGLTAMILSLIEKGNQAIAIGPVFGSYKAQTEMAGGKLIEVPLEGENLKLNLDALQKKISKKTKLIILNTPQNPTGKVFTKEELKGIADIAIENNLLVLTDEIYEYLIYEGKHCSIASFEGMQDRAITVSGFSKTYAMTGFRVGYLTCDKKLMGQITNTHTHMVICAPSISQMAALAALKGPQACIEKMRKGYLKNRNFLLPKLEKLEFRYYKPNGAYYIFADVSNFGMGGMELANLLLDKANVAIVPGIEFGPRWKNYVRISFSNKFEEIKKAAENIEKAINKF